VTRRAHFRGPKPDGRRALELLARCGVGCSEAIMEAHGFSAEQKGRLPERNRPKLAETTRKARARGS
jgi:hypothetical protein